MPPRKHTAATDVYVAREGFFSAEFGLVNKDERVRAGHPLLSLYADQFKRVDEDLKPEFETTTAAPNELRGLDYPRR